MGRAPVSEQNEEKNNMGALKRGPWSAEEDQKLIAYIRRYGIWNWTHMPKPAGLARTGKSCRLRWMNYLRPNIKHGNFSKEEEEAIFKWHQLLGNRWSAIAGKLPGRTDNEIKNYWNTRLKKHMRSGKLMQAPSSNHPGSQLAIASPLNIAILETDQPNIVESPSQEGMSTSTPKAPEFKETSMNSTPIEWINDKVRDLESDFWEQIILPPLEDLSIARDLKAMSIVSSGFELLEFYSIPESTNGYLIYDILWEN